LTPSSCVQGRLHHINDGINAPRIKYAGIFFARTESENSKFICSFNFLRKLYLL